MRVCVWVVLEQTVTQADLKLDEWFLEKLKIEKKTKWTNESAFVTDLMNMILCFQFISSSYETHQLHHYTVTPWSVCDQYLLISSVRNDGVRVLPFLLIFTDQMCPRVGVSSHVWACLPACGRVIVSNMFVPQTDFELDQQLLLFMVSELVFYFLDHDSFNLRSLNLLITDFCVMNNFDMK